MLVLQTDNTACAAATAPIPETRVKPKLQPLAGLTVHQPSHAAAPLPQPVITPILHQPAPVQPVAAPDNMKATVFAAENRPASPWAAPVAPKTSPFAAAQMVRELGIPAPLPDQDESIEGVRKLIFGRHMNEMQTKVAELQMALSGEIKRLREALMNRVDEMAGYLHRDMVILREETQREMNLLKTDLSTAATSLSGLRDRLGNVEKRAVEETRAALADIDTRITRQESSFATALDNIETKLNTTIESKCANALAVLAKKSEVAEVLSKMGTLLEEPFRAADSTWIASVPEAVRVEGSWAALADAKAGEPAASDWMPSNNPFMDQSLIT